MALLAIPQSLAYAELAGMPPQYGLFASALPPVAAALFVSSKYLQTGAVALTALLTFGALSTLAAPGSPEYIGLAALLALMVGFFRTILGLVRVGEVAYLLSEPVLTGFTTGAAVLIIASQTPRVLGASSQDGGVLTDAFNAIVNVGEWRWSAVAFAASTAFVVLAGRRLSRLFPGVLVAVVVAVIVSSVIGYDGSTIGLLEGGFVSLGLDFPWASTWTLLIPAFAIGLVGFAEPSSIARTFAAEERLPWDANREMISQGVANIVSGISGAFPVGGSFARSALSRAAGATSAWAGAIAGLVVLLAIPLTPQLEDLPTAVLGAIIIVSVAKLLKFRDLAAIAPLSPAQAIVGIGTFIATLVAAPRIERAVLVGIGLSLAVHLYREMSVSASSTLHERTLTVAPNGVLWFATVPQVDRLIRNHLNENPDIDHVIVDLAGVGRLDFTGAAALGRIVDELIARGISVHTKNVRPGASRAAGIHLTEHSSGPDDGSESGEV